MFEWLELELNEIKTNKFHVVDGPADNALRQAVESCNAFVPPSYKQFVLRFGNAYFYRELSYYKIGVLASLREERYAKDPEVFYRFGHFDANGAYFKESLFREGEESPVFEGGEDRMHRVADGFESWLIKRCNAARRRYNKRQWAEIIAGPPPFTPGERRIVDSRRRFRWRIVGIAPNDDVRFEIYNGSDVVLPFLSIGIRGKQRHPQGGGLNGGAWLPVSSVLPGEIRVVEKDCYKKLIDPHDVEAFALPDPEPEDRDRYWEFKTPT